MQRLWKFIHEHEWLFFTLVAVMVLRIPNVWEPYWYGDEGIYLVVGQALEYGRQLYAEIIDHKTPLIYWVAQVAFTLTNLKLVLVFVSLGIVTIFYFLSRLLHGDKNPWFYRLSFISFALLTTLPALEGNILNGEILLMPFVLLGVMWFWHLLHSPKTQVWEWLVAGSFFGLAVLTKVPSGFDFVAVGFFYVLVCVAKPRRLWPALIQHGLLLVAGFLIPIALSVVYFAFLGDLDAYLDFGLLYNFRYIQSWGTPFDNPVLQWLVSMQGRLVLLAIYLSILFGIKRRLKPELFFILIWFGFTLFAALLSLRPYPHYALQLIPPATLLMGYFASSRFLLRAGALALLLVSYGVWVALGFRPYPTLAYYGNFVTYVAGQKTEADYRLWFDGKMSTIYDLADYLRDKTEAGERIFIWGNEPMVYALSRRIPAGRFIVDFHIESFEGAKEETMSTLESDPPRYVVVTRRNDNSFGTFYTWLEAEYRVDTHIGYATVYKRRVDF
jgi:4-amino-4-deoxy-L-arabinose transferase-like glycosyltransferase